MESLLLLISNLLSPPVIAFTTGLVAVWARSDLRFPEQAYQVLTIYLLLAIGFKGGTALVSSSPAELILPLGATFLIGGLIPVCVFLPHRPGCSTFDWTGWPDSETTSLEIVVSLLLSN